MKEFLKSRLLNYLPSRLALQTERPVRKRAEFVDWVSSELTDAANGFILAQGLVAEPFIRGMGRLFATSRFELFLKKWTTEYLFKLFDAFESCSGRTGAVRPLALEDAPLHRFALERYSKRFSPPPEIRWQAPPALPWRMLGGLFQFAVLAWLSLRNGVRLAGERRTFKVLRETIWGLQGRGSHFHDDFFVDGETVKPADLLLFSRDCEGKDSGRTGARADAKRSAYAHFDLPDLPMGAKALWARVLPVYMGGAVPLLLRSSTSPHFSLFSSLFSSFAANALPYEAIFSSFQVASELGHNYFTASHIAESIVCENHGTSYFLMHWSDNSVAVDRFLPAFLGCDKYLVWGPAHLQGFEGGPSKIASIGYHFKDRIRGIRGDAAERTRLLALMGAPKGGKVVVFLDETFGGDIKMTEDHFLSFWGTIAELARTRTDVRILVKPKGTFFHENFSAEGARRFAVLRSELARHAHVRVLDPEKWSFIEAIGVADLVLTQGMTSSSTIALLCGIDALYLDEGGYDHPFRGPLLGRVVFDSPAPLLTRIEELLDGDGPGSVELVPEDLMRSFDAFSDDRGIDRLRGFLTAPRRSGPPAPRAAKVGIVVQARMGSTRLPGKALLPLAGRPMLEGLLERLKRSRRAEQVIVATTLSERDDAIARQAGLSGVPCFRGSEEDVLERYHAAAKAHALDVIVRVTSDCPLMDPALIDELVDDFLARGGEVDYLANTLIRTYPRGYDIEVFSFEALDWARRFADRPYQREHVTPYLYEYAAVAHHLAAEDASVFRVTVDTPRDLEAMEALARALADPASAGWRTVVDLLRGRPDIAALNRGVEQKALA